jgi:uncharacterized protein YkwD
MDMAQRNYFSHYSPEGISPFDRMRAEGISYRSSGENIIAGYSSSISAHEGWVNSAGHRSNILGSYIHLGVGFYKGGSYGYYYTQNFYTPF